jgi:GNAT superfamily N-acetyltransferase
MASVQLIYSLISAGTMNNLKALSPTAQNQEDRLLPAVREASKGGQGALTDYNFTDPGVYEFLATAYHPRSHEIIGFVLGNMLLGDDEDASGKSMAPLRHAHRERIYVFVKHCKQGYATQILQDVLRAERAAGARWTTVAIQLGGSPVCRNKAC